MKKTKTKTKTRKNLHPQIMINLLTEIPDAVCRKMGWGRFSKSEDFAIVHKGLHFVLGFDHEEGFRFMVPVDSVESVVDYIKRIKAAGAKVKHVDVRASTIPTFPTPTMVRYDRRKFELSAKKALRAAGFVPAHIKTKLGIFEEEVLDPKVLSHDCWDHSVPYKSDGPIGHGFECGVCHKFLQAG